MFTETGDASEMSMERRIPDKESLTKIGDQTVANQLRLQTVEHKVDSLAGDVKEVKDAAEIIAKESLERAKKYDHWLDLFIAREEQKARFRKAVMEKGLLALMGSAGTIAITLLWEGMKTWLKQQGKSD